MYGVGRDLKGSTYVPAFLKSTDGGKTWAVTRLASKDGYLESIAVDPKNRSTIYVGGTDNSKWKSIFYKSTNSGKNWTQVNNLNITYTYIKDIAVDPASTSIIYVATNIGVYKSPDGGSTWTAPTREFDAKCVKVYPNNPKIVFAGGRTGVYYSSDRGKTWVEANKGISLTDVTCLDWNLKKKFIYTIKSCFQL